MANRSLMWNREDPTNLNEVEVCRMSNTVAHWVLGQNRYLTRYCSDPQGVRHDWVRVSPANMKPCAGCYKPFVSKQTIFALQQEWALSGPRAVARGSIQEKNIKSEISSNLSHKMLVLRFTWTETNLYFYRLSSISTRATFSNVSRKDFLGHQRFFRVRKDFIVTICLTVVFVSTIKFKS